jgi:hypothetical protein
MRNFPSLALLALLASGCVITSSDSSLYVENRSDFEIHEMYVTPVASSSWGTNLLGGDVLLPDETMAIGLACDTYDALLIDELGYSCEVHAVHLCFEEADWIIRNSSCAVFEERAAAAAAAAK